MVYSVNTRHATAVTSPAKLGELLVWGTFRSLLKKPAFVQALTKRPDEANTPAFPTAKLRACAVNPQPMPKSASTVIGATVVVHSGQRLGSGTFISPDGYVLTAAHVLVPAESVEVQLQGGQRTKAEVVRVNRRSDVALLRLAGRDTQPCLAVRKDALRVGDDIYAVGSPLGNELSFSVTRGIVSGFRTLDGVDLVQTDASVNRGNSGGPLVDANGRFIGVVSWKAIGAGVEGIAFGIPTAKALDSVGIEFAEQTDASLAEAREESVAASAHAVVDTADASAFGQRRARPLPSSENAGNDQGGTIQEQPGHSLAPVTGTVLLVGGSLTALYFTVRNEEGDSPFGVPESLGWGSAVVGVIILAVHDGDDDEPNAVTSRTTAPQVSASVGPMSASVQGVF